jgi:RES domain-containing protein
MDKEKNAVQEFLSTWILPANAKITFQNFLEAANGISVQEQETALKEVYDILDNVVLGNQKEQFKKELHTGETYYRARIIRPEDYGKVETGIGRSSDDKFSGYNEINSREPILGISGVGRNNLAGVSYLYVASNEATACMEVKSQFGDLISLATFVIQQPLVIIDFSRDKAFDRELSIQHNLSMGVFFTLLMSHYSEPVKDNRSYRATQIISDYLRKTGIDGVAYRSSLSPGGVNYTIFNSHPSKIKYVSSKILIHKQANHSFWDLNEENAIFSNPEGKMLEYDSAIAKQQKDRLKMFVKIYNES